MSEFVTVAADSPGWKAGSHPSRNHELGRRRARRYRMRKRGANVPKLKPGPKPKLEANNER